MIKVCMFENWPESVVEHGTPPVLLGDAPASAREPHKIKMFWANALGMQNMHTHAQIIQVIELRTDRQSELRVILSPPFIGQRSVGFLFRHALRPCAHTVRPGYLQFTYNGSPARRVLAPAFDLVAPTFLPIHFDVRRARCFRGISLAQGGLRRFQNG